MTDRIRKIQIHHEQPCLVVFKFLNSNSFIGIKGIIGIFVLSILQNLWWGGASHFMHLCVLPLTTHKTKSSYGQNSDKESRYKSELWPFSTSRSERCIYLTSVDKDERESCRPTVSHSFDS